MPVAAPIRPRHQQLPVPRCHRASLPAYPQAVAEARRQVRAAVRYWRLDVDLDAASLLTSELVTNAVTHDGARRGTASVVLAISAPDGDLRVDVYDSCPLPPAPRDHVSPYDESGRGLQLVDSLAADWGAYPTATGKGVYFILASQAQHG